MHYSFRAFFTGILFAIFFVNQVKSQPTPGKSIDVSIGYGLSTPIDDYDITGTGFYAQGEYVFALSKWFGIRPYAGFIITSPQENSSNEDLAGFEATSKAFLIGGKIRVCAPIPWVAPYLEGGIGLSLGSFTTITPEVALMQDGALLHIPFTLGLAIGKKNELDFEFTYYFHPSVEQISGAIAIGLSFPLK